MKFYYLRVVKSDLVQDGDKWVTGVVDLYDNDTYKNFSVTKTTYGLRKGLLHWIGLRRTPDQNDYTNFSDVQLSDLQPVAGDYNTDTGMVRSGRYIDTSGRIDIVSYRAQGSQAPTVILYTSEISDGTYYKDEWLAKGPVNEGSQYLVVDSARYARFAFDVEPADDFEILFRIEIDSAVMMPLYRGTRQILGKFPSWMKMARLPEEDLATPTIQTPPTIGAKLINAMAGEWIEDASKRLSFINIQRYIDTVDLEAVAWSYAHFDTPDFIYSVVGDGTELARVLSFQEFITSQGEDVVYIDEENNELHTLKDYTTLTINGVASTGSPNHIRNYLDEFGLFVDLHRLHLENNDSYKKRILDVFINRGGIGVEALKLALRRELNIWAAEGATPDSAYAGATPEILEVSDIEQDPKYFNPDGLPTQDFIILVEKLSREHPTTWGRFIWDKAVWDSAGLDGEGYGVVPYQYDTGLPARQYIQPGVGDGDDLFIFRPDVFTGPRNFNATLSIRGFQGVPAYRYKPVTIDVEVFGEGDKDHYDHDPKTVWFSVEIVTSGATPGTWIHSFTMTAVSDVDNGVPTATPASYDIYRLFSENELTTSERISFNHPTTNDPYDGTGVIEVDDIDSLTLKQGQWVAGSYQDLETQDHFEAWFSHDETEILKFDTAGGSEPSYGYTMDATPYLPLSDVVMKSLDTNAPVSQTWTSEKYPATIVVNDAPPFSSTVDFVYDVPEIIYDQYVTNKILVVQITSTDPYQTAAGYGGIAYHENGDAVFIPASVIDVNSLDAWTDGRQDFAEGTSTLTFSVTDDESATPSFYPIEETDWVPFKGTHSSSYAGIVDENGPWIDGNPQLPNTTNFTLTAYDNLTRADFSIPDTDDYVVTWMGVESDNDRVLVWLDTNVVKPVNPPTDIEINYSDDAIVETLDGGFYDYSPVTVRSRIRPGAEPSWTPQMHSGFYYDKDDEYYVYAQEGVTTTSSTSVELDDVIRQGAPVIVWTDGSTPRQLRQVAFFDDSSTPYQLSFTNTETVSGNNTPNVYVSYTNLYDVSAVDEAGNSISVTGVSGNVISLDATPSYSDSLSVSYKLSGSFYVDNDYTDVNSNQKTMVYFDATPSGDETEYTIYYEKSHWDLATPVGVQLNPMYTTQSEGFIYISKNEYDLSSIRVRMDPTTLLADGDDYSLVSLYSVDVNGNPKPNQTFNLSTDFGTLDKASVTTDHDGFGIAILTSSATYSGPNGTLTITGDINATVPFSIVEKSEDKPKLYGTVSSDVIVANGLSSNSIYGRIEKADLSPGASVTVTWKKARFIYELFNNAEYSSGTVVTDANGVFEIDGFTSDTQPGYWFVSLEATVDTELIGDVVFWTEHQDIKTGSQNSNNLPHITAQDATPNGFYPQPVEGVYEPYPYDEDATPGLSTATPNWQPPAWYAESSYQQSLRGSFDRDSYRSF